MIFTYIVVTISVLKSKSDRLCDLSNNIKIDMTCDNNYNIYVSKYFHIDKDNLKIIFDNIKRDTKIQDITFFPQSYGLKVYSYTIIDTDTVDLVIKNKEI